MDHEKNLSRPYPFPKRVGEWLNESSFRDNFRGMKYWTMQNNNGII